MTKRAGLVALAAAAALQVGLAAPAGAVDPMMHSSASVGSTTYGTWGDNFTCGTCHRSSLSGGNAKTIAPQVNNRTVNFTSYLSYGDDTGHATSDHICEVCHTKTSHHRYDNSANGSNHHGSVNCTGCHLHIQGFRKNSNMESSGGAACDGCHSDLYINTYGWGMHSTTPNISYRHFMENALTGSDPSLSGQKVGTSFYSTDVPNSTNINPKARRCLMCHVDHDQFKGKRGYNLRPNAWLAPTTGGTNRDDTLCLSCHVDEKTKAYAGPNLETTTLPIPYPRITYANATSVLNFSTHGYPITSNFKDSSDGSTFMSICSKCHNDSIGKNGETAKSYKGGQTGTYKFGAHNSTLPGRFAVFSTDFYQRILTGTTLTPIPASNGIQISPSPGWVTDQFKGHYLVVTAGAGSNQRALVTGNSADTLTVQNFDTSTIDNTSAIDVTDDNIPVDNTCFSCHSKSGEGKSTADLLDWYGQKSMSDKLAAIFDIFTGDLGTMPANLRNNNSATVYLKLNTWNTSNMAGYVLKLPNARQTITAVAGPTASGNAKYPYSYTLTLATRVTSNPGAVEVLKPATHPLDMNARHSSDERSSTGIGWNAGDQGTTTAANYATNATQISDGNKLWSGIEFKDMIITFPNLFANGQIVTSKVTGGGKGVVTFTPAVSGLTTTGGDSYFIGKRHVSCADCHNPHASFKNPEGKVSSADAYHMADSSHVRVPGWYNDIWKGFLLKVRNSSGLEQIRFVTAFDNSNGTFTVSLPWSSTPAQNDEYEVLMGDKWSVLGQNGGRAGSGSSGQWGVIPTAWPVPALRAGFNNMTTPVSYRQIENVFDNVSSTGLRGSTVAGQRDLCVRCHSSYAYRTAPPATPSGKPDLTITPSNMNVARGTDISKEFNPNNMAHHAVYARGKNQPIVAGNTGRKTGTAAANSSTTVIYGSGFDTTNYVGKTLVVVAGIDQGQARLISASTTTTLTLASALTTTPSTTGANATQYVVLDSFNPNWPIYNGLGTGTVTVSGGQATFTGATPPSTTLPGWFLYTYNDNTWREVRTIEVRPADSVLTLAVTGGDVASTPFILTAGLGNAFVPPFGPWSILRCTDCHGSTKTDPVGPHASVNNWLIKDADTMQYYWFTGGANTNVSLINQTLPTSVVKPKAYFCYNCHRRDVYGDKDMRSPVNYLQSRQPHANYIDTNANTTNETLTGWKVHCRMCHGGDRLGGIHGTNLQSTVTPSGAFTNLQGQRFLNGSAWGTHNLGVKRSTTQAVGGCYTLGNPADATVDACNHSHSGTSYVNKATYDY